MNMLIKTMLKALSWRRKTDQRLFITISLTLALNWPFICRGSSLQTILKFYIQLIHLN